MQVHEGIGWQRNISVRPLVSIPHCIYSKGLTVAPSVDYSVPCIHYCRCYCQSALSRVFLSPLSEQAIVHVRGATRHSLSASTSISSPAYPTSITNIRLLLSDRPSHEHSRTQHSDTDTHSAIHHSLRETPSTYSVTHSIPSEPIISVAGH